MAWAELAEDAREGDGEGGDHRRREGASAERIEGSRSAGGSPTKRERRARSWITVGEGVVLRCCSRSTEATEVLL